ncbi:uncharacterized protein BDW70DRAFT_145247 [Aspergillus foveolatus]|uniref:uncharacterized protein n=1 Tax=Aspergillus foveolatus TaxID=210207 RepID=UPI003CCDDA59
MVRNFPRNDPRYKTSLAPVDVINQAPMKRVWSPLSAIALIHMVGFMSLDVWHAES